jgi:hypothetical protein
MTTFALNYKIGGLKPFSYHIINFIIHLSNAILVYWLVMLTLKTVSVNSVSEQYQQTVSVNSVSKTVSVTRDSGSKDKLTLKTDTSSCSPIHRFTYSPSLTAFLASALFAVHPIQTQAVTYVVQRAEILSSFFYLLSLVMFVKARAISSQQSAVSKPEFGITPSLTLPPRGGGMGGGAVAKSYMLYAASFLSAVLSMGSKEIAVTLPLVILLYDFFFISNGSINALSKRWKIHLLFFLTLIPLMYFMGVSQLKTFVLTEAVKSPPTSSVYSEVPLLSRYEYLLTQFRVVWTYIRLLIVPINQNVDYNYPVSKDLLSPVSTLFGGVGIVILLLAAVFLFKKQRLISFFIFWFFIVIAPTSSIAALPDVIFEHRVYLGSLGYFVIFAMGVFKVSDIIFKERKG